MTVHTCGRPDCTRKHHAKGLCKLHWRRERSPQRPPREAVRKPAPKHQAPPTEPKAPTARKVPHPPAPEPTPAKPIAKLREVPPARPLTPDEKDLTMRLLQRYDVAELAEMLGVTA